MYSLKQETTEQGQKFDPPPEVVKLTLEVTCKISRVWVLRKKVRTFTCWEREEHPSFQNSVIYSTEYGECIVSYSWKLLWEHKDQLTLLSM